MGPICVEQVAVWNRFAIQRGFVYDSDEQHEGGSPGVGGGCKCGEGDGE